MFHVSCSRVQMLRVQILSGEKVWERFPRSSGHSETWVKTRSFSFWYYCLIPGWCRWTSSTASTMTSWPGRASSPWTWSTAWARAPCRWPLWGRPAPSPTSSRTWCTPPPCPVQLPPTPDRWDWGRRGRGRTGGTFWLFVLSVVPRGLSRCE